MEFEVCPWMTVWFMWLRWFLCGQVVAWFVTPLMSSASKESIKSKKIGEANESGKSKVSKSRKNSSDFSQRMSALGGTLPMLGFILINMVCSTWCFFWQCYSCVRVLASSRIACFLWWNMRFTSMCAWWQHESFGRRPLRSGRSRPGRSSWQFCESPSSWSGLPWCLILISG